MSTTKNQRLGADAKQVKAAMVSLMRSGIYPSAPRVRTKIGGGCGAVICQTIRRLREAGEVNVNVAKGHRRVGNNRASVGPFNPEHEARIIAHQARVHADLQRERGRRLGKFLEHVHS